MYAQCGAVHRPESAKLFFLWYNIIAKTIKPTKGLYHKNEKLSSASYPRRHSIAFLPLFPLLPDTLYTDKLMLIIRLESNTYLVLALAVLLLDADRGAAAA